MPSPRQVAHAASFMGSGQMTEGAKDRAERTVAKIRKHRGGYAREGASDEFRPKMSKYKAWLSAVMAVLTASTADLDREKN